MEGMTFNFKLPSAQATELLGRALAQTLPAGSGVILYLHGELGAGKTTLVRALLRELGVVGTVKSPTYTLIESYEAAGWNVAHVDLYRLVSQGEVAELALQELLSERSLLLIEWPERAARLPPPDAAVSLIYEGVGREAQLLARTPLGERWLDQLRFDTRLQSYLSNLT
jgi:tRNA threonylcarbamoyladenosine biosynthesis protein TsaE